MLGFILYTVAGLVLYFLSDWILNQIEVRRGQRFENRSVVFFVIILALAVVVFSLIDHIMAGRVG
jgi:predicted PurR-regulated permease PerM